MGEVDKPSDPAARGEPDKWIRRVLNELAGVSLAPKPRILKDGCYCNRRGELVDASTGRILPGPPADGPSWEDEG